jgi:hypothetical protein
MHVDDLTLFAILISLIDWVSEELSRRFEVTKLGEIRWLLGFRLVRDRKAGTTSMSQRPHFETMLVRFKLDKCKPTLTPISSTANLGKDKCPTMDEERDAMKLVPYKEAIGCLMWGSIGTRPDISFAVNFLAQFMANPGKAHWEAVKHLMHYIAGTLDYVLILGLPSRDPPPGVYTQFPISIFSDSDWASQEDRHSICSYVFRIGGSIVSWSAKKQHLTAQSSTEAEYIAAAHATREMLWLNHFLEELGIHVKGAIPMHLDNNGSIDLAVKGQNTDRSKHIDVRHHILREAVEHKVIELRKVDTSYQLADLFTKALPASTINAFLPLLGIVHESN